MNAALAPPPWIIDYHTAKEIFEGANDALKELVIEMANNGYIKYSYYEHSSFTNGLEPLKTLSKVPNIKVDVCDAVKDCTRAIPHRILNKKHHPRDPSSKIIAATALTGNFRVLSNKQGMYATPLEIAANLHVAGMALTEFCLIAELPYP